MYGGYENFLPASGHRRVGLRRVSSEKVLRPNVPALKPIPRMGGAVIMSVRVVQIAGSKTSSPSGTASNLSQQHGLPRYRISACRVGLLGAIPHRV